MMDESAASPLSAANHDADKTRLIILSYLTEPPAGRVEFIQRRLKGKFGVTPVIVASWFSSSDDGGEAKLHAGVRDFIVSRVGASDVENNSPEGTLPDQGHR
jgi:hypothetical protein